jgi:uncharacterized protein YbaP (TraB family)
MARSIIAVARTMAAATVAAGLLLLSGGTPARAEPGLWFAKGPNATIYLFGTIHVLRKNQAWETPDIANALAASQELWLEVPDPDNVKAVQPLIAQLGADPQHPLSTKLSPPVLAHLDEVAKSVGMHDGEQSLEPMRPWLAAVALEDALIVHAGYDPQSGVEPLLLRDAVKAGKSVRGFETLDQQMRFFADMPPAVELELLQNTLEDFDQGASKLDALVDAWMSGDDAAITRTTVDELRTPFPELYRTLVVQRNEAWADAIAQMLKGSGVKFIAVGAAHLVGPDSVQTALKRRGVDVERVRAAH